MAYGIFLDSEFTSYIPVSLFGFMGTLSGEEEQTLKPNRLVVKFHGYVNNCCKLIKLIPYNEGHNTLFAG